MFTVTCFVESSTFVRVMFWPGDVRIRWPGRPGSSITLNLPCTEILTGNAHDPKGSPGLITKIVSTGIFWGGDPFPFWAEIDRHTKQTETTRVSEAIKTDRVRRIDPLFVFEMEHDLHCNSRAPIITLGALDVNKF